MARIRSVKPEFWHDRKLARRLTRDARMLYIGLWNVADEHGRANGDPLYIKGQVFPYDDDLDGREIDHLLEQLATAGCVQRYDVDEDPYLHLPSLGKHQRLEAGKVPSRLPAPPDPREPARRADESARTSGEGADRASSQVTGSAQMGADESARDADESSLLYVAGSREQVAGSVSEPSSDAGPADEPRPDVEELCSHLADRIAANGSKRPTITRGWRDACRLMIDRDERTPEQIRSAIDWCQGDEFWRGNVLSMPKLREQYDRLRLAAQRPAGRGSSPTGTAVHDLSEQDYSRVRI